MPKSSKKTKSDSAPATLTRRSLLNWLWLGLIIVAVGEVLYVVCSFLRPQRLRTHSGEFGTEIEAGPSSSFATGSVTAFPRGQFYLCRLEDGGFLAVSRKCTHLGCTVPWDEAGKRFACPCHASVFDRTGAVIRSPAPRPLDIFPIRVENDVLYVDTGRPLKRSQFRKEQVVYPKSAI
ncbi:MAG TPA: ubiquinol-cytochrome c reductase iron-sulfur subunit [Desulfobacterales bacterium]